MDAWVLQITSKLLLVGGWIKPLDKYYSTLLKLENSPVRCKLNDLGKNRLEIIRVCFTTIWILSILKFIRYSYPSCDRYDHSHFHHQVPPLLLIIIDSCTSSLLFQALMILGLYNCLLAQLWKLRNHDITNPNSTVIREILQTYHRFVSSSWIHPKKMAPICHDPCSNLTSRLQILKPLGNDYPSLRPAIFGETWHWESGPLRFPWPFAPLGIARPILEYRKQRHPRHIWLSWCLAVHKKGQLSGWVVSVHPKPVTVTNEDSYRFKGIPYWKWNNPSGDCYSVEGSSKI